MTQALDVVRGAGGGPVHWWVFDPTADDEEVARQLGLTVGRELLQMRRALPTDLPYSVTTRPFVPGVDEAAWVEVNNRAFADHPEQGGWTRRHPAPPRGGAVVRPGGLPPPRARRPPRRVLLDEAAPRRGDDPPLGEIYVIGVDPDFQGLGLGRPLTLAGLDSIAARGVDVGMLYVDAANTAALAMYERLGLHGPSHRSRLHRDAVNAATVGPTRYEASREDIAELLAGEPRYRDRAGLERPLPSGSPRRTR